MEEIASTDALEKEILEDARRKGEKILKDGEAEAARIRAESAAHSEAALDALDADFRSRTERYENENLARLPLEKGRLKATYIDRLLVTAMEAYLSALPAAQMTGLVSGLLARAGSLVGDDAISVRFKGMDEAAARGLVKDGLPRARLLGLVRDETLPAAGLVLENEGAMLKAWATLDLVGEKLLDRHRGELARVLCAEAMTL